MNPKVLLVEDDSILAEVYSLKFELEGFEVRQAINGVDALKILAEFKPDIILLDLLMPVMNGWEFMERLGQTNNQSRVVVFSNMLSKDNLIKAKESGAIDAWVKSEFTPEKAAQKIIELCR